MIDKFQRRINYLRISITDRCNLRCEYCMPNKDIKFLDDDIMLTKEQIIRLVKCFTDLGITKVRFTGGEPLMRADIDEIIKEISSIEELKEICLTTNGILLKHHLKNLKNTKLNHLNISLDTLKEDRFKEITRGGELQKVLNSLEYAIENHIDKIRINVVVVKGKNDDEILDFLSLIKDDNIDVRFIELMPIGMGEEFSRITSKEILDIIGEKFNLTEIKQCDSTSGPAKYYKVEHHKGRIGTISAISDKFCDSCNRVRITCNGDLKKCLYYKDRVNLKKFMDDGISDEDLKKIITNEIYEKPEKHKFEKDNSSDDKSRMFEIGG